jgi:formate/nitrite transporter FocA (FNT family)
MAKKKTTTTETAAPKESKRNAPDVNKLHKRLADDHSGEVADDRAKERKQESEEYQSVIIKRTDETFRHADDVLEMAIHEGKVQLQRPALSLFMSSLAAGMIIGFTVLAVAVMATVLGNMDGVNRIFIALLYPLGFVLCILSRTQLFTEHTATAVYPLLDKSAGFTTVIKLWATVIVGNLAGGLVIAGLLTIAEPVIHAKEGYIMIANHVSNYAFHHLFFSAVLAGWLMAIAAWTILTTHSTPGQIICIYIATFIIGIGGLHHSIAGSVELFVGVFMSPDIAMLAMLPYIGVMLLGNAVGGSVFVALVNYGHIRGLK